MMRVAALCALLAAAEAGFCDSRVAGSTGYHCRGPLNGPDERMCPYGQEGGGMYSQFCSCGWEMEMKTGRRQLDGTAEDLTVANESRRALQSSVKSSRRRSSSSSRRRSSSTRVELEYECDKVGEPVPCRDGCNPATGQCVQLSASQRCGTLPWEPGTSTPATFNGVTQQAKDMSALCPEVVNQLSFENIMDSSFRIGALLTETESNMRWFEALMTADLYAPNALSPSVTSTCTAVAGSNADCQLTQEELDTSDACTAIAGCKYETRITPPASLPAAATSLSNYRRFACSRNFPQCVNNQMQMQECMALCEDVSLTIAQYSAACEQLDNSPTCRETAALNGDTSVPADAAACAQVDAASLTGEADCLAVNLTAVNLTTPGGSDDGACTYTPSTFECYTLGGRNGLPGGYDASGVRLGNGCANTGTVMPDGTVVDRGTESWCHVPARPGATCTLCAQQGWERDCQALCTEAAPSAAAAPNYQCRVPYRASASERAGHNLAVVALGAAWSAMATLL